jgi:histidinol-phosphatase (PHP family)
MIPCDLHVHPDYSIDARSSIEQYCHKARQIGLQILGFTTHYDVNPIRSDVDPFMIVDGEKVGIDDYAIGRYCDDCLEARKQFPDLKILIGLEVDYFIGVEADVVRLKSEFPIDYLIGAVHCLEGIAISSKDEAPNYFSSHNLEKMANSYYDLLYNVANCGLFDVIGHADYYLRHGPLYYGENIVRIYEGRLEKVVESSIRTNTGFEINTAQAGLNGNDFYPGIDFLKKAVELGAKINSVGSDSHHVDYLGSNILEALKMLRDHKLAFDPFYENN